MIAKIINVIFDGNSDDVNGNYFKFIIYYDLWHYINLDAFQV